jgi:hypothetical protein
MKIVKYYSKEQLILLQKSYNDGSHQTKKTTEIFQADMSGVLQLQANCNECGVREIK